MLPATNYRFPNTHAVLPFTFSPYTSISRRRVFLPVLNCGGSFSTADHSGDEPLTGATPRRHDKGSIDFNINVSVTRTRSRAFLGRQAYGTGAKGSMEELLQELKLNVEQEQATVSSLQEDLKRRFGAATAVQGSVGDSVQTGREDNVAGGSTDDTEWDSDVESDGAEVWVERERASPALQGGKLVAVESAGGKTVVELFAAWDALALRLPSQALQSSEAQLLVAALKLVVPALKDSQREDGRPRAARALAIAMILADLRVSGEIQDFSSGIRNFSGTCLERMISSRNQIRCLEFCLNG